MIEGTNAIDVPRWNASLPTKIWRVRFPSIALRLSS